MEPACALADASRFGALWAHACDRLHLGWDELRDATVAALPARTLGGLVPRASRVVDCGVDKRGSLEQFSTLVVTATAVV